MRDNPFYGKYCDFFSVDFKLDEDNYSTTKSALVQSGNYFHDCQMDDFDLWLREDLPNIFLIAFCDEQMVIRCILATDCDSAQGVAGGLIRHTSLEWQVK